MNISKPHIVSLLPISRKDYENVKKKVKKYLKEDSNGKEKVDV